MKTESLTLWQAFASVRYFYRQTDRHCYIAHAIVGVDLKAVIACGKGAGHRKFQIEGVALVNPLAESHKSVRGEGVARTEIGVAQEDNAVSALAQGVVVGNFPFEA